MGWGCHQLRIKFDHSSMLYAACGFCILFFVGTSHGLQFQRIPCVTEAHIEYRPFKNLHNLPFYPHKASNLAQPRIPHHHRHNLLQRRRRIRVRHTRQTPHLRNILRISAKVINYTPQSAPSPHSTPPSPGVFNKHLHCSFANPSGS